MNEVLVLRPYQPEDCSKLIRLFKDTVHTINSADCTPEQIEAWAGNADPERWNQSLLDHLTLIAEKSGEIVGFADLNQKQNLLDRLYIAADHQKEGIASALCDALESRCKGSFLQTEASITARPFFEKRGYQVLQEQQACRKGVLLKNFRMEKRLS